MNKVKDILVRSILNSSGNNTFEVDVVLDGGAHGRASAPSAIAAGRRENKPTAHIYEHLEYYRDQAKSIIGFAGNQLEWDDILQKRINEWGTDLVLSLSLAFARAVAKHNRMRLVDYISECNGVAEPEPVFTSLIPIFSGGIHDRSLGGSMQQIMLSVSDIPFKSAVHIIAEFYRDVEQMLMKRDFFKGYSASSGFLVRGLTVDDEFAILSERISKSTFAEHLSIAVDVAAEHLKTPVGYKFYQNLYSPDEINELLLKYVSSYPISYIEDPFDFIDHKNWVSFHKAVSPQTCILSDDLSATQIQYIDAGITDGVIVKMKQVGTLSETLGLIKVAKAVHLKTCISHRSTETEDTFMCDLGIATNADYMKIGGPRRGDRVEKYNQLLRILAHEE